MKLEKHFHLGLFTLAIALFIAPVALADVDVKTLSDKLTIGGEVRIRSKAFRIMISMKTSAMTIPRFSFGPE